MDRVVVPAPADDKDDRHGKGSLAHLCRAGSVEAALAWYAVLTPEQRENLADVACIRELIARSEFELLAERMAQSATRNVIIRP